MIAFVLLRKPPAPRPPFLNLNLGTEGIAAALLAYPRQPTSSFDAARSTAAQAEGEPRTGPVGGTHEPRAYAFGARWASYAERWPCPPELLPAVAVQSAITASGTAGDLVRQVGAIMSDGDGVLWVLPGPQNTMDAAVYLVSLLRKEFDFTGRTVETSRLLWYLNWPRVERSPAGWVFRGIGEEETRSGRGAHAELGRRWNAARLAVISHHGAQNGLHPDWMLWQQSPA